MMEITGYKDVDGNDIYVGDIMFNPFFGDFWLVEKYTQSEKIEYDAECDYCLSLYGSKDCHIEDLNTPAGFRLVYHKDAENYSDLLNDMLRIAQEMNQ